MWDKSTEKRKAIIYGNYAVLKNGNRRYSITYVPTGQSACGTTRMTEARLIAKAFNKYFPRVRKNPSKAKIKDMHQLISVISHSFSSVPEFIGGAGGDIKCLG